MNESVNGFGTGLQVGSWGFVGWNMGSFVGAAMGSVRHTFDHWQVDQLRWADRNHGIWSKRQTSQNMAVEVTNMKGSQQQINSNEAV